MGRGNHTGSRSSRSSKEATRPHDLGCYIILTDAEKTEVNYFNGLKQLIPEDKRDRLSINPEGPVPLDKIIEKYNSKLVYANELYIPVVVFDHDQVTEFNNKIFGFRANGFTVGWSNPCFEVFLHGYFGTIPTYGSGPTDSQQCCDDLARKLTKVRGRTITTEQYKRDPNIYTILSEILDTKEVIKKSKAKYNRLLKDLEGQEIPASMEGCSNLHELIAEILDKIEN